MHDLPSNGSIWQQIGHSSRPGSGERTPDAVDNGGDNETSVAVLVAATFSRSSCWDGLLEDEGGDGDVSAATLVAASSFSFGIGRAVWNVDGGGFVVVVVEEEDDDNDFFFKNPFLNPNDDAMVLLTMVIW